MNCNSRSLKLLDMPLLCQKLGFNKDLDDERITSDVNFGYNNKVLVGNWLDNRCEDVVNREMELSTIYREDFKGCKVDRDLSSVWDNRLRAQGGVDMREGLDEDKGLATVYDLAYRWRMRDLFSEDHDHVTGYGRKECKRLFWEGQQDQRSTRFHTEYADQFFFTRCPTHITY